MDNNFSPTTPINSFSSPEPIPPLAPPEKSHSPLKIALIIIASLLTIAIAVLLIVRSLPKPEPSSPSEPSSSHTPDSDALTLREQMYNGSSYTFSRGVDNAYMINVLNEWIKYPNSEEVQSSLAVFSIYLLLRYGLIDDAVSHFDTLLSLEPTDSELCELYRYRTLIAEFSGDKSLSSFEAKRDSYCEDTPVAATFSDAKSAFLKGNYSSAIVAFEDLNYSSLSDEEKIFAYSVLADHYKFTNDTTRYNEIINTVRSLYTIPQETN